MKPTCITVLILYGSKWKFLTCYDQGRQENVYNLEITFSLPYRTRMEIHHCFPRVECWSELFILPNSSLSKEGGKNGFRWIKLVLVNRSGVLFPIFKVSKEWKLLESSLIL